MSLNLTVGGAYATSFIRVSEADDRLAALGVNTTHWDTLEYPAKELRLIMAANIMDSMPLAGGRVYINQALCFPRSTQLDVTEIPDEAKDAQAMIACMIVDKNFTDAGEPASPIVLDNALVKSVEVMGVMRVSLQQVLDPTVGKIGSSVMNRAAQSFAAPIYWRLKPYLTQIRGGVILPEDEEDELLDTPEDQGLDEEE